MSRSRKEHSTVFESLAKLHDRPQYGASFSGLRKIQCLGEGSRSVGHMRVEHRNHK